MLSHSSSPQHRLPYTALYAGLTLCIAAACYYLGLDQQLRPWFIVGVAVWMALLFLLRNATWLTVNVVIGVSVVLRIAYLNWPPLLSDDVYRYLWDGLLQHQGINPFAYKPQDISALNDALAGLFPQLNSPGYYSVYQPISQFTFWLATWFAPTNVQLGYVIIKGVYTAVELLGIVALLRLVPTGEAILYAWSPFAVMEVAGQGHAEGIVVGALGLAVVALHRQRWWWVGVAGAVAVWTKLIPLLVAPLFLRNRAWWKVVVAGITVSVLVWWPYAAPYVIEHIRESTDLYIRLFEFNAGLYLLLKELLLWWTGDDWSKQLGPLLRSAYLWYCLAILIRAWRKAWDVPRSMLWILGGYLVFATTVHPWYLLPILYVAVIANQYQWFWLTFWSTSTYLFYSHDLYWPFVWIGWGGWLVLMVAFNTSHILTSLLRVRATQKARRLSQLADINTTTSVLDIGAGEGFVAEALVQRTGASLMLTDVEMTNMTALPFARASSRELPFSSNQFDVSYSYFVLHHAQNPKQLIEEALRVTRNRVIVAESVFTTDAEYRRLKWLDQHVNRLRGGWMTPQEEHLTFKRTEDWVRLFEANGAQLVSREDRGRWLHRQTYLVFEVAQA